MEPMNTTERNLIDALWELLPLAACYAKENPAHAYKVDEANALLDKLGEPQERGDYRRPGPVKPTPYIFFDHNGTPSLV